MAVRWGLCLILLTGCVTGSAPLAPPPAHAPPNAQPLHAEHEPVPEIVATPTTSLPLALVYTSSTSTIASVVVLDDGAGDDDDDELGEEEMAEMDESRTITSTANALRYTIDISDEELALMWKSSPESLGSIAIGFADEGRVINSMQCPAGDGRDWFVVSPHKAFGTVETISYVITAIKRVRELYPEAPPLRINNISSADGGYLRPHRSHQNGRDVDLAFYYPTADPVRTRAREKAIDVRLNWELLKALITLTDVEVIWVDYRVQAVIYDYALAAGEDKAWLDSIFKAGRQSIVQHARRHRDHFHVRFFNGRAQELGRRVAPLLAQRPEQNMVMVRVRSGDTLGGIAAKYGSSVRAIQKANRMRGTFLRIAQVLKVPLRGPCTRCPVPPAIEVPPRRLPPPPPVEVQAPLPVPLTVSATTAASVL